MTDKIELISCGFYFSMTVLLASLMTTVPPTCQYRFALDVAILIVIGVLFVYTLVDIIRDLFRELVGIIKNELKEKVEENEQ